MSLLDAALHPDRLRLVDVTDDAHGVRCQLIDRASRLHVHCVDPASIARIREALATDPHPYLPAPTSALCDCPPAPQEVTTDGLA